MIARLAEAAPAIIKAVRAWKNGDPTAPVTILPGVSLLLEQADAEA
jgi:hypothetical protein